MTARSPANSSVSSESPPTNSLPVPQFNPAQLAAWTAGQWTAEPEAAITGFGIDTRKLEAGTLFVALKTESRDGHDFLEAAREAGAAGALVSAVRPEVDLPQLKVADPQSALQSIGREHRRTFAGPVIGITGSAGKTSTKNMLAAILGDTALATEANLNNHLGVPLTLTRLDNDQHRFGIIEAGINGPDEMDALASMIEPDVAIVTLVDHAHTAGLGSLEGVAREKVKLPAAVASPGDKVFPASVAQHGVFQQLPETQVVVERVELLANPPSGNRSFFMVSHRDDETMVSLVVGETSVETYQMVRVSDGMAQNAALAATLTRRLGITYDQVKSGLAAWRPAAMRGEVRRDQGRFVYLDCYNANPCAMADALETFQLRAGTDAPRLYLLGGMEELGEESDRKHRELGASLELRPTDQLLVIGTGADQVRAGAMDAGASPLQVEILDSLEGVGGQVAAWEGAVFIKGSRRYRLEMVLAGEAAAST